MENGAPFILLSVAVVGNLDSLKTLSAILQYASYVLASKPYSCCLYKLKENNNISNVFIYCVYLPTLILYMFNVVVYIYISSMGNEEINVFRF